MRMRCTVILLLIIIAQQRILYAVPKKSTKRFVKHHTTCYYYSGAMGKSKGRKVLLTLHGKAFIEKQFTPDSILINKVKQPMIVHYQYNQIVLESAQLSYVPEQALSGVRDSVGLSHPVPSEPASMMVQNCVLYYHSFKRNYYSPISPIRFIQQ